MDLKTFIFFNFFCILVLYFNPFAVGDAFYGLCANSECSTPISKGITILRYSSPDDSRISVEPNEEVQIYVKEYGPKKDLWGVIVRGNRGYISKNFIRETNSFKKELVPAIYEFKTPILLTDSYTASSQLHVSPHPHQPDVVSQPIQHTQISDYNLMSSIHNQQPNNFHSAHPQPNSIDLASNNFQQHQDSMHSTFQQQENFMSSTFLQPNLNSADNFQQQQGFMNSVPNTIHKELNSLGENQAYNSPYNVNPGSDFDLKLKVHQMSQFSNFPEQSSHLNRHLENGLNSYEITGMQSQDILPSSTHAPNVHSPSHEHFPQDPVMTSSFRSSVSNMPNSFDSGSFNPNVDFSSQTSQNSYLHTPSEQLQNIRSPHVQEIHPTLYSNDYSDEDYSKTLAMLRSRGSDMYVSQETNVHLPNENAERNVDFNAAEFNSISSQSIHPSVESISTTFHSSADHTLHVKENNFVNVNNPKKNSDNILHENINSASNVKVEELAMNMMNDANSMEENEELESFSEENIDVEHQHDDEEEEEEEEEDEMDKEENDISTVDELVSSAEKTDNIQNQLNMQSFSASQIKLQASEGTLHIQSSQKDSIHDFSAINTPSKDHSTVIQREQLEISSSKISSVINTVPQETFSEDVHSDLKSTMVESVSKTQSVDNFVPTSLDKTIDISLNTDNPAISNTKVIREKIIDVSKVFSEDLSGNLDRNNNDAFAIDSNIYKKEHTTPKISDFLVENEKRAEVEQILSPLDIEGLGEDMTTYQGRNLKGEYGTTEDPLSDSEASNEENNTQSDSDSYSSNGNWFDSLKAAIDAILSWIPEPLYSTLMDLQKKGISPRVPVFTTLCGFTCIFLIVPLFYLKDRSKESQLTALLAETEKKAYEFSAANIVLEEKLESAQTEVANLQTSLAEEKSLYENLRTEFENQAEELENAKAELESCLEIIDALKEKENEYLTLMNDYEKEKECYDEHKESLDKIMKDQENSIENLTSQLQESESKVEELEKEKEQFLLVKTDYEDKLAQFERNCNQLLQEAEVWNMRVNELTENVNAEIAAKEELMTNLKSKDEEIQSLKELLETFNVCNEIEDPEEQVKTKEEKLQFLLNSAMITNQLKKEEEKGKLLDEQLQLEKNKILDMEVELLDAKSEIDKLKLNYNQALQDKAEAQTKLEVLTNYFKDKEIQLQRQLGAQEADRQKKEEDVNSAERRIMLIEQENASYKSQVASMKQEMEETERTLRSQIASQEKKAHENWIAARAAERNLENMKQEVTQLRQRLTLLEREQENWANSSRDEIIRPVPKRISGVNEESGSQETSERGIFPMPPLHDRLPLPPMMLPPDRPLPPLPPPPMPPMFLPPPPPPMERHFRPQPWHMPPDHNSDYRTTPPEFMVGRESTPPRGRPPIADGDTAPNTSSPMTTDTRDSRNSTPPHLLPDFHDIPPQPGRPYFPPPVGRPRYPMHPSYRRDAGPELKRLDNQNESNLRGPSQPPATEQWQHSRV